MKKALYALLLLGFVGASAGLYLFLSKTFDAPEPEVPIEEELQPEPEPQEPEDDSAVDDPSSPLGEITLSDVDSVPPQDLQLFSSIITAATNEAAIDRWEHAKSLLRRAIDSTSNTALRAIAGKEMGNVLYEEAKVTPWPNALAAQQYLEGARELELNPERKKKIEELLSETQIILYSHELRTIPDSGSYFQMEQMLKQAGPVMTTAKQQIEFKLYQANANQQLLLNKSWFKEYMRDMPDSDPMTVKDQLRNAAISDYTWLVENATGTIRDEAYFRMAQLMVENGEYDEADQTIQAFLNNEPMVYIPETMILLARIAQATGDSRKATHLLTQSIDRYGITRQAQEQLMNITDALVEEGFYKEASETLKKLSQHPQMEYRSGDLYSRSQLLLAEYYRLIDEPENAEEILSKLVLSDFSPAIKQAAVSKLFEMRLSENKGNIEMLLTGIQAVEADPDNEHAKKILVQMAKTVEQMGLPQYAQQIYDKIALLGMAVAEPVDSTNALPLSIEAATLGTARCYYKEGSEIKADYLLRKICNNYEIGALQSEAAFWWAQIAFDNNQLQEASRRLGLMDLSSLPASFTAKARVLDQFINIKLGISNDEIIRPVLEELAMIPQSDYDFLQTYYSAFFNLWDQRDDLNAMKQWYSGCLKSPHKELIPLNDFFYRIANRVINTGDLASLIKYIKSDEDVLLHEQREKLLQEVWADYLPRLKSIKLGNMSLKLAINELYQNKR